MPYERPPDSSLLQRDRVLLGFELAMARRINEERVARHLGGLGCDALLSAVARAHSAEMRDLGYFAHESPTPHLRTPADRYEYAYGKAPRFLAENVACQVWSYPNPGGDVLGSWMRQLANEPVQPTLGEIEQSHQRLMNSPGHRANILEPSAAIVGVGIVSRNRDFWVTQLFSWRA